MSQIYKKAVLGNGTRVITHRMPKMQSVALGIWIKVGGRYESTKNKGISHYLEHLAFKGTKIYSCRQIKESIEGVGGSLNAFTSEELTCYLAKLPSRYLDVALNILSDMVINPVLSKSDMEKERTVILEEIKMHMDLPQSYVYELLDELLWPDQPLGMSIIGSTESVNRIDRRELSSYKKQYYAPLNIVISAAGLLDHNKLVKRAGKFFSHLENYNITPFATVHEQQEKPNMKILPKDTEQTHLVLGFHGFKRDHPLRHALGMLHVVLGANMSSRLFNELREKRGLAYEIGTLVRRFQDTGAFIVHAGIDNRKVDEAIKLILEELENIKDRLVNANEFRRAKEFYSGQLMLALEDTLEHMLWIGEYTATMDKAYSLEDVIGEVSRVEREDVREVARSIFKEKSINLALIGPLKNSEDKIYRQLRLS